MLVVREKEPEKKQREREIERERGREKERKRKEKRANETNSSVELCNVDVTPKLAAETNGNHLPPPPPTNRHI